MPDTHIAIIFDFDDTLIPDTTSQLLEEYGVDADDFWENKHAPLLKKGYDPANGYMNLLLEMIGPDSGLGPLTTENLQEFGSQLDEQAYPGLPGLFDDLDDIVSNYYDTHIDYYTISGGLRNVIMGTELSNYFSGVYSSELAHGNKNHISRIKRAVNFTEKTRYLFEINKGLPQERTRKDPFLVNKDIPQKDRRIPWENMIYVGDGLTDVPCFSLIQRFGGKAFAVFNPEDKSSKQRALELVDAPERVRSANEPKYRDNDALGSLIRTSVQQICAENEMADAEAL